MPRGFLSHFFLKSVFWFAFFLKYFLVRFFLKSDLGHGHLLRLEVVAVQVALEVEVGQHIRIGHAEQGLQLGIGLDRVLILQVLLLHVGGDRLGHVGARLLGTAGAAEEGAQLVGQRGGELEDRGLAGLRLLALHGLLNATLALVRILLEARHALLQALQLGHQRTHRLAHGGGLGQHRLHVILDRGHSGLRGIYGCRRHGGHGRRHNGGSHNGGSGGRRLLALLLSRGRGHHRRGGRNGLSNLLGNGLRRLGGRGVHCTGGRGSIHGGNTH